MLVLLPTLLCAGYYTFYAADLYETEARILVRGRPGASGGGGAGAGLASILGATAGSMRPGAEEAQAVVSFIDSLDAVTGLQRELDLPAIWRRPEADLISRLHYEDPVPRPTRCASGGRRWPSPSVASSRHVRR
ncbi:MAG: hypothetical protein B7Z53_03370 [Rhodospirillales bacterium 12-71-4]|nr:MAG: hypothetical protein B7Z53_03370 [Rhodospirillales bacterium 12-71-4]